MLTPEQSRAARGWLDWTQAELAERARVSLSTVKGFESGERKPIANNVDALERAFADEGIRLTESGGQAIGIAFEGKPTKGAGKSATVKG